jgi:hypothetical protein
VGGDGRFPLFPGNAVTTLTVGKSTATFSAFEDSARRFVSSLANEWFHLDFQGIYGRIREQYQREDALRVAANNGDHHSS